MPGASFLQKTVKIILFYPDLKICAYNKILKGRFTLN